MEEAIFKDLQQRHQLYLLDGDEDLLERLGIALTRTQRLASIGSLATGLAQELSSPLSVITSACSSLLSEQQENTLDSRKLEQFVALIERNAVRSENIVKVLHKYAYMDEPHMAMTDVNAILQDALTLVKHQFLSQGDVAIEVDLADQAVSAICDHNHITQVLVNLLLNAYDAMKPQGGTIKVGFWTLPPDQLERGNNGAQKTNGSGKFAFSVIDKGHGIDAAIADEIFKPFFTTRSGGTRVGLGLFIAKGIVQQHNGHIWVENNSRPSQGARATVILPVRP